MKYIFHILLLCCFLNSSAQKDKTLSWVLPQEGFTIVTVSKNSTAIGENFYAKDFIVPQKIAKLHIDISTISTSTGKITHAPFAIQIKSRSKEFANVTILDGGRYQVNIPLINTDSLAVNCIIPSNVKDTTNFYISYSIGGDTAELNYANKSPQAVFEKMLELARTGFINLYDSDHGNFAEINYPDGLFAPNPAVREKHSADVTQYTGKDLDRKPADKIIAEWNKKVKTWLNDYHVTDIKKNTKGDIKLNTDEEETLYTKKNAQGVKLFVVTVFKEVVGEGSEAEPMSFTTGVRISN